MYIDIHVHDRDFTQSHKETVSHALEVARDSGLDAILVMPNTSPAITTEEQVKARLQLRKDAKVPEVFYGIYIGATSNPEQLKRAVELYKKYPEVIGMKLYAGESVGDLAVINPTEQLRVFETLSNEGYNGILAIHAEKEENMHKEIWNALVPISHCIARPARAETESIKDIIYFAKATNYKGPIHIAHISTHEGVMLVNQAKKEGLDFSSSVCPHHLFYDLRKMLKPNGIAFKVNPPLRSEEEPNLLLEDLREGRIDCIETDHAPHSKKEKLEHPFMSGIVSLWAWPLFERYLQIKGFSEKRISGATYEWQRQRYNLDVSKTKRPIKNRSSDYPINHWTGLEEMLRLNNPLL
ncbi:MAG: dihydroorotase [Nanoarchaeota archaeon]